MKPGLSYRVFAQWGPRQETPEALAARWLKLIGRLRAIDPIFDAHMSAGSPSQWGTDSPR